MKQPVFKNKDGTLTRYSLACGYVDTIDVADSQIRLSYNGLSFDVNVRHATEHPHYADNPGRGGSTLTGWGQYDTLTEARRATLEYKRRLKQGETLHDQILTQ